jgi:uncharacterized protein (TIGR03083 family)
MEIAEAARRDGAAIKDEAQLLLARAQSGWDLDVPTCPGWHIGSLVSHTGRGHRWAAANLESGRRVRFRELAAAPDEPAALPSWYREGLAHLLGVIDEVDPLAPVWTFGSSGGQRAWWWARRMAQETGIHRWDADHAAGETPARFDPEVAAAGVDEYLADFLPRLAPERFGGLGGSLHLHTTDAEGEWVIDLDQPGSPVRREHAKSDTAVRGPASDLLLWLWNRQPAAGHLDVFGTSRLRPAGCAWPSEGGAGSADGLTSPRRWQHDGDDRRRDDCRWALDGWHAHGRHA